MGYRVVLSDIKQGELKTTYLLYGSEMYLKDIILKAIKAKYIEESLADLNYIHINGSSASENDIINACETLPFMSEKKLVVVEDLSLFKPGEKDSASSKYERLTDYIENINSSSCLIFILNEDKVDNRRKIIKNIKKSGRIVELDKLKREELYNWTINEFKKHKKNINRNIASYFISQSGYEDRNTEKTLYDLENETNKVISYIGERDQVVRDDIDSTKARNLANDIFKLVDSISQKNTSKAIEHFNEMVLSGEPIQRIMYMIIRQIRLLLTSKLFKEKGYDNRAIGQKINLYNNYIIQKTIDQSRTFSEKELVRALKKCRDIDRDIKTGIREGKLGMEVLIIELSQNI